MSLWKLRVGVESYYLAQIASGLDEYYTGAGEAPGRWTGTASTLLGLEGDVAGSDLRAVLAGLAPGTGLTPNGSQLVTHPRRVPGFDLTFAVPKSVSVLWALGDPLVQAEVNAGCEAALAEVIGWLEREACFVRRGTNNRELVRDPAELGTRRMVADGFVAAQFQHRTSRLGDPHLHWHVLVANTARGIDGRWTALDGTALYRSQRTVGVLFQAVMRSELGARLGIEWGPIHNDSAEIAGIPPAILREFSRRHEQIAEWLDLTGRSGVRAAGQALLETRTSKQHLADMAALEVDWHARAEQLGWGPRDLERLLARPMRADAQCEESWIVRDTAWSAGRSTIRTRSVGFEEWVDWLLTERVTEKSGTFTRFDLTKAVAAELSTAPTGQIDATVNRALASPAIVPIGDHWRERPVLDGPNRQLTDDRAVVYTSRSLLATEQRLLTHLHNAKGRGIGVLDRDFIETAIGRSGLGDDQAKAIRSLCGTGDTVAVMVGRAGTGKTRTLGTLREAYEATGWNVIGLAPSARAARELHDGAAILSTTIARHRIEQRRLSATTVVVIDEAAMAGTRDVTAIIDDAANAGAKVILVGDHHQLPEVAAGGAFRAALDVLGEHVTELTVNRRQANEWERHALDELRCGDVTTAFHAYRDHGRVIIADSPDDIHALVLADWHTAHKSGADTLLLAGTRSQARLLNRYARSMLADNGTLDTTAQVTFAGREYTPGDRVVMCRNDPHQHLTDGTTFNVDNGMRGTIADLSPEHMVVHITSGEDVVLSHDYLDRGWVDHAYAVTIHKAQGVTCDNVLVVGPAGLYREGAYVALSRARHTAHLYVTSQQAADIEDHRHGIPLPTEHHPDPEQELLDRLHVTAAKNLVTIDDPTAASVADLVATIPTTGLLARARHARDAQNACGLDDPAEARAALTAATEARHNIIVGRRVRATDRDNVGHIVSIDDADGTCIVHFESSDGRSATRKLDWAELVVIDHPGKVAVTAEALDTLERRGADVENAERAWAIALAKRGVAPGEADLCRRAVHTSLDNAARALHADPPEWLTTWLGPRPTTPAAAAVWDDATTRIAHHRALHATPHETHGIGNRPAEPTAADRWQRLMLRILEDRLWLTDHYTPRSNPTARLTPTALVERRAELRQEIATAPLDHRQFIDRIVTSQLDPTEMHDYLSAALASQDARRAWIVANWPHLVELEQITALVDAVPAFAHWPASQPDEVRHVLEELRSTARPPSFREDRTLAEIDRDAAAADPVRVIETRRNRLQALASRVVTPAEREVVDEEIRRLTEELRTSRRARLIDKTFDRYTQSPANEAHAARIATISAEVLTTQPDWVVDHLRSLHERDLLRTCDIPQLAASIVAAAAEAERTCLDPGAAIAGQRSTPTMTQPVGALPESGGHW